jgi:hypothetical protein
VYGKAARERRITPKVRGDRFRIGVEVEKVAQPRGNDGQGGQPIDSDRC